MTPLAKAGWVKRHRNHNVRCELFLVGPDKPKEPFREETAERRKLLILQQEDRARDFRRVKRIAARKLKIVQTLSADPAQWVRVSFAQNR
jgi:hypothetical protein